MGSAVLAIISHDSIKRLNVQYCCCVSIFPPLSEVQLPPPRGVAAGQPVPKRPGDFLADVHHLGGGQPVDHVPTQHARPSQNVRLVLGLLHQPQRCRLPHQVRDRVRQRKQKVKGSFFSKYFRWYVRCSQPFSNSWFQKKTFWRYNTLSHLSS